MTENNTFAMLKEREREARRKLIIDAAERVFGSKPFNKVSMRDIAREAGISPASIYRYFPDQQTLFVEAFLLGAQRLVSLLSRRIHSGSEVDAADAAEEVIVFLNENDHYFRMMTNFMLDGQISGEMLDRLNTMERSVLDQFDELFRQLGLGRNVRLVSHAFFAAINGVLITFRNYPGRTEEEVRRHMSRVARTIAAIFSLAIKSGGAF